MIQGLAVVELTIWYPLEGMLEISAKRAIRIGSKTPFVKVVPL